MDVDELRIVEDGDWEQMILFCEQLSEALEPHIPGPVHEEYEQWRPKQHEGREEVADRTNDRESLSETQIERDSAGTPEEMAEAAQNVRKSGDDVIHGRARETARHMEQAGGATARGILPHLIRLVRRIERWLYTHIVGRTNPDYFEASRFTVSIEHRMMQGDSFRVQIAFNDAELGATIAEHMEALNGKVSDEEG